MHRQLFRPSKHIYKISKLIFYTQFAYMVPADYYTRRQGLVIVVMKDAQVVRKTPVG